MHYRCVYFKQRKYICTIFKRIYFIKYLYYFLMFMKLSFQSIPRPLLLNAFNNTKFFAFVYWQLKLLKKRQYINICMINGELYYNGIFMYICSSPFSPLNAIARTHNHLLYTTHYTAESTLHFKQDRENLHNDITKIPEQHMQYEMSL